MLSEETAELMFLSNDDVEDDREGEAERKRMHQDIARRGSCVVARTIFEYRDNKGYAEDRPL